MEKFEGLRDDPEGLPPPSPLLEGERSVSAANRVRVSGGSARGHYACQLASVILSVAKDLGFHPPSLCSPVRDDTYKAAARTEILRFAQDDTQLLSLNAQHSALRI